MGSQLANLISFACVCMSALLCLLLCVCYALRPDVCAAVTVFPVWAWLVPGLALASPAISLRRRRMALVLAVLWLCYLVVFAEEARSLARALRAPSADKAGAHAIRVISLNCAGGDPSAAAEVVPYHPDIVLLQEAPPAGKTDEMGRGWFGREAVVISGWDTAILARGELITACARAASQFTWARIRLPSGSEIVLVSARLSPPSLRFDLWSSECWREQARLRRVHRAEMAQVALALRDAPRGVPVVIGGDFNAAGGDAVLRVLRPRLRDAFREAGRGWGNTASNGYPILRFDQVWVSKDVPVVNVVARKTQHSDHRMVICDLELGPEP